MTSKRSRIFNSNWPSVAQDVNVAYLPLWAVSLQLKLLIALINGPNLITHFVCVTVMHRLSLSPHTGTFASHLSLCTAPSTIPCPSEEAAHSLKTSVLDERSRGDQISRNRAFETMNVMWSVVVKICWTDRLTNTGILRLYHKQSKNH